MFQSLSERLGETFKNLSRRGKLGEEHVREALAEVRLSLIDADVNFQVVKGFIAELEEKAVGERVLKSLSPTEQVIKIVYEELTRLMGGAAVDLELRGKPPVPVMLVGLQGSGKTTTAAKLARRLRRKGRRPLLVPADVYRPAAIEQLKVLAGRAKVEVFDTRPGDDPLGICHAARDLAKARGLDVMVVDTSGRLHVDDVLMNELVRMKEALDPRGILLVADAMTGQDAVNIAGRFHEAVTLTGVILTKLDGDARGGAALSIRAVTGVPITLVGMGEGLEALEVFHPDRVAARILDMGDLLTLVEKAQETYDREQSRELENKVRKGEFTIEDFIGAMRQLRKLGAVEDTLKLIPGIGKVIKKVKNLKAPEEDLKKIEAIVNSMTPKERRNHKILDGSRRRRIAAGSGAQVHDVNTFVKQYEEMRKMMRRLQEVGAKGVLRGLPGLR